MTDEDVVEARRMQARFVHPDKIAKHFGVTRGTLRKYLRRSS
jgi:hypothetical protein